MSGRGSVALVGLVIGLGCGGAQKRPYPEPSAAEVLEAIASRNQAAETFRAESVMDYRVDGDRVKGTVLIAGKRGARIRFNAENPTGGNVAVDLACDGTGFEYVNYNANCQLSGPCNESAIAQLLRVRLEPDEFMLMAVGGVPLVEHTDAKLEWNADQGRERLTLMAANGERQVIELSGGRERTWDVVEARLYAPNGELEWKLQNKDFSSKGQAAGGWRLPGKSLFEQPLVGADLLVQWRKRELGVELPDAVFDMEIPVGLPVCGSKK